tara:strand:- start:36 stop:1307 length:1272 start_codon:yes stop_codon:yes gene_type:complete
MGHWNRKAKSVDHWEPLHIFRFPFYMENILVIVLFSFMFILACLWAKLPAGMGIRSVSFWILSITLFFNYAFVIVEHTSRGLQHIPKLSSNLAQQLHDVRLYLIAILTIFYLSAYWEFDKDPAFLVFAFITYPLAFSLLVISRTWASLLNPVRLFKSLIIFVFSIQSLHFFAIQLVVGSLLFYELQVFFEVSGWHVFWAVPLTLISLFVLFRALGVLLNHHGERLGIPVLQNAESHQAAVAEGKRRELDDFVAKLYRHVRVHNYKKAWAEVEEHLQETNYINVDDLFVRLCEWDDKKVASRLGSELIGRLVKNNEFDRALRVFRECCEMSDGNLRLPNGSVTLILVERARDPTLKRYMYNTLQYFDKDFPNHPSTLKVFLMVAEMALKNYDDKETGALFLQKARDYESTVTEQEAYKSLSGLI